MVEIRELVKGDSTYDNLTKEEEEEMKNELLSYRELKKKGARTTNKSAAQDYRSACANLNDEVCQPVSFHVQSDYCHTDICPLGTNRCRGCCLHQPFAH